VSFEGQEDWVKAESGGVFTSLLPPDLRQGDGVHKLTDRIMKLNLVKLDGKGGKCAEDLRVISADVRTGHCVIPSGLIYLNHATRHSRAGPQFVPSLRDSRVANRTRRFQRSAELQVAGVMRRILVDHARQHRADKRGGAVEKVSIDAANERLRSRKT
jgi:hypothetical protein